MKRMLLALACLSLAQVCAAKKEELRQPDKPLAEAVAFQKSPKRGVGHYSSPWDPSKAGGEWSLPAKAVDELKLSWYYNWDLLPMPHEKRVQAEFVPMAWDQKHSVVSVMSGLKAAGYKALLGFNEPGQEGQAQMTVKECLDLWPRLEATGLRLGSPAPADAVWLDEFMPEAIKRGLRVDFLALHTYPEAAEPDTVESVRSLVRKYWKKYNRPVWLTEYSIPAFPWYTHGPSMEENAWFARDTCLILDSLPYVERYAWFSTGPNAEEGTATIGYAPTSLFIKPGEPSPAGVAYRDAMLRPDLGLRYRVYKGSFKDFSEAKGKADAEGRVVGFDLWADDSEGDAAVEYEGLLQVERDGIYEFKLTDDGSTFYVGGEKVGKMGIGLAKGRHKIRVTALRLGEHPRLRIAMRGPGIRQQPIPLNSIFFP